jgi:hypothetical protein
VREATSVSAEVLRQAGELCAHRGLLEPRGATLPEPNECALEGLAGENGGGSRPQSGWVCGVAEEPADKGDVALVCPHCA